MRLLLFALIIGLLSLSVVADVEVSLFPLGRTIRSNESAVFELELKHDSFNEELFEVYSSDVTWDVRPEDVLRVKPGDTMKTNLIVTPLNVNPGAYNVPVNVKRAGTSKSQKYLLYIEVQSENPEAGSYLPAVRGIASIEKKVDPRNQVVVKLSLENQNRRILDKVEVKVRSNVINKDYTTSLGPLEKKTLKFIADVDPKTPPQKDVLQISVIVPEMENAYQFDVLPVEFEVLEYGTVVPSVREESSFLKYADYVALTNEANKQVTNVYRVPAWFGKRLFISSVPDSETKDGNLEWEVTLNPGESAEVIIVYNYRPIFWILLVAGIVAVAYFILRSPVKLMKRARIVSSTEDGFSELKVILELVNRGSKTVHKLKVMDLVPHMTGLVEDKDALLVPTNKISHEQKGTLIQWDIPSMDSKEHRIIMYRLKTKLKVLGGMTLPVAAAHFAVDGNPRESVSNKPEVRV